MFRLLVLCLMVLSLNTNHPLPLSAQTIVHIVTAAAWSPDGTWIATGHAIGDIKIWDVEAGDVFDTLRGHTQEIMTLEWSPDGTRIASGSPDGSIRIWDVASGETTRTIQFSQPDALFRAVLDIAWSPDSTRVGGAFETGYVTIWEADTGEQVSSYTHDGMAFTVEWNPAVNILASGGADGKVLLWDMSSQTLSEFTPVSTENVGNIYSIAWSPDGDQIALGLGRIRQGIDVKVFNFATHELLFQIPDISDGIVSLRWSPDGLELAVSDLEAVVIVDGATGLVADRVEGNGILDSLAWSPYGGRLAVRVRSSEYQPATSLGNSVQIVIPAPSLERLQAIAEACNAPATIEQSLTASIDADRLTEFVAQVESLPADAIPPACRADLLAVAEALAD